MNGEKARRLRKFAEAEFRALGYKHSRPLYKKLKKGYKMGKVKIAPVGHSDTQI